MKISTKKFFLKTCLMTKALIFVSPMYANGLDLRNSDSLLANGLDEGYLQEFKSALNNYMDSIKKVADQLTEDAEVKDSLIHKVKARTESVKAYTCWANAYRDYGIVLNSYYEHFLSNARKDKEKDLDFFLIKAIKDGKIIQSTEDIDMPDEFKSYIEVRKQFLLELVYG